jgi:hypothetical protein
VPGRSSERPGIGHEEVSDLPMRVIRKVRRRRLACLQSVAAVRYVMGGYVPSNKLSISNPSDGGRPSGCGVVKWGS